METINLLNFLIKSGIGLGIVWFIWLLVLRKTNNFKMHRIFLVYGVVISLMLPALTPLIFSLLPHSQPINLLTMSYNIPMVEVITVKTGIDYAWQFFVLGLYALGCILFIYRIFVQIYKLLFLSFKGNRKRYLGVNVIEHSKEIPPFSFFSNCYINPHQLSSDNFDDIIKHESVHIKRLHSYDILLMEIVGILHWFNPFYWMIRRALVEVHEFQVDEQVLSSITERDSYMNSIVSLAFSGIALSLGNNFNKSLTLKRLAMMNTKKVRNYAIPAFLLSVLLAGGIVFTISCSETEQINAEEELVTIKAEEDESVKEQVFIVVETMPVFDNDDSNNMVKFREFIAKNLKYPAIAAEKGIQGRVYVTFVVDSNGEVEEVKIERGVDPILDAEAIRVVQSSPKWQPGKQRGENVAVQFTFPIIFTLK